MEIPLLFLSILFWPEVGVGAEPAGHFSTSSVPLEGGHTDWRRAHKAATDTKGTKTPQVITSVGRSAGRPAWLHLSFPDEIRFNLDYKRERGGAKGE